MFDEAAQISPDLLLASLAQQGLIDNTEPPPYVPTMCKYHPDEPERAMVGCVRCANGDDEPEGW